MGNGDVAEDSPPSACWTLTRLSACQGTQGWRFLDVYKCTEGPQVSIRFFGVSSNHPFFGTNYQCRQRLSWRISRRKDTNQRGNSLSADRSKEGILKSESAATLPVFDIGFAVRLLSTSRIDSDSRHSIGCGGVVCWPTDRVLWNDEVAILIVRQTQWTIDDTSIGAK